MRRATWASLGILAVVVACQSEERDPPTGGTGPIVSVGAGGHSSASGTGGTMAPATCEDAGVVCVLQTYHGDCSAFSGKRALWTFLSYDTTVPADAHVEFAVRTADTEADLETASFEIAGVAEMGSELVPPSVPIHLDEVLSTPDVTREWLELRISRVDGSDGQSPSVEEWDLSFSCEDF